MNIKYSLVSDLKVLKETVIAIGAGVLITLFSFTEEVKASDVYVRSDTCIELNAENSPTICADVELRLAPNVTSYVPENNDADMEDGGNPQILEKFISSMLSEMKPLDGDISKFVDDNFWDLI